MLKLEKLLTSHAIQRFTSHDPRNRNRSYLSAIQKHAETHKSRHIFIFPIAQYDITWKQIIETEEEI